MSEKDEKRIIGHYGEMSLAMALHKRRWQVYRAYIDEQIDFIITRYYCNHCQGFSFLETRKHGGKNFLSDLCENCKKPKLEVRVRYIQVKTSAGVENKNSNDFRKYSFHAKLRSNVDYRSFYVWIALVKNNKNQNDDGVPHFYIFNHEEVNKFDNLQLDSYQKTDNQKTTLRIDQDGKVLNKGRIHSYDCFNNEFHNNFNALDMKDKWVKPSSSPSSIITNNTGDKLKSSTYKQPVTPENKLPFDLE